MNKRKIILGFFIASLLFFAFSSSVRNIFKDSFVFIKTFFIKPSSIGAIIPSSQFLASAITKHIKRTNRPIRILEVGAGTGSITSEIIKKLGVDDLLDVIELDQDFCNLLTEKFGTRKNVNIRCISILDWAPLYSYDFIISGLPFNAFDLDFVVSILDKYKELVAPGGMISYFEYIALAKIKMFFLAGKQKDQFSKTLTTTTSFRNEFEFENEKIFANMPPAYVHHLYFE